jgi:hypothetical protein|tara:strand:+ start:839 stop:1015 length:177 start_codon:yes stop_codon:yes gene_type:complete
MKKVKYKGHGRQERRGTAITLLEATIKRGTNHEGTELTKTQIKRIETEISVLEERLKR